MPTHFSSLEPLEPRIAPATLTFIDIDGDAVTVKSNKGTLTDLRGAMTLLGADGGPQSLQTLDLASNPIFKGAIISIQGAKMGTTGNNQVDVGLIDATGVDLRSLSVVGDVGLLLVGDDNLATPAVQSLAIRSLGVKQNTQPPGTASYASVIHGAVPYFTLETLAGSLTIEGGSAAKVGTILLGNLQGGSSANSGLLKIEGSLGKIMISGDFVGGGGSHSGSLEVGGSIGSVEMEGAIRGGTGSYSGALVASKSITSVSVRGVVQGNSAPSSGDHNGSILAQTIKLGFFSGGLQGGAAVSSGMVNADASIGRVAASSLQGGAGQESGSIVAGGYLKLAEIGDGNNGLQGGAGLRSGSLLSGGKVNLVNVLGPIVGGAGELSGSISTVGAILKVTVDGDIQGGSGMGSGSIGSAAFVQTATLKGDLLGGSGSLSGRVVSIVSLGTISVQGDVRGGEWAR